MKIRKVTLNNFRTFKNFELSFDKDKTIIFAGSGKGKTTLKEAILMGLHANMVWNEVFDDVKKPSDIDNLFTKSTLENSIVSSLSIKLELEDEEFEYFIEQNLSKSADKITTKRFNTVTKKDNYFEVVASKRALNNAGTNITMSQYDIETLFPLELAKILFFSGEIERLSDSRDLKTTLYDLFDLNKYEKTIKILEKVKKDYEKEIIDNSTGDLNKCAKEILDIDSKINKCLKSADYTENKKNQAESLIHELDVKIEQQKEIKDYSSDRKINETKIINIKTHIDNEIKNQARKLILKDKNTMYALQKNLQNVFTQLSNQNKEKRLITGINQSAIDQILTENLCVCGNHLSEQMVEYINNIRDTLPPNEIGSFQRDINKYLHCEFEDIDLDQYDGLVNELRFLESSNEKLSNLIKDNIYDESIEYERMELSREVGGYERDISNYRRTYELLSNKVKNLEKEEAKLAALNNKVLVIKEKLEVVNILIEKCKQDYNFKKDNILEEVENEFYKMLRDAEVENEFKVGRIFDKNYLKLKVSGFSEGQKTMLNTFLMLSVLRVSLTTATVLPAILDGFISKQGLELTKKTMSVINKQENQLILFTLDKDKSHVDMSNNDVKYYELKREATDDFSRIEECTWN